MSRIRSESRSLCQKKVLYINEPWIMDMTAEHKRAEPEEEADYARTLVVTFTLFLFRITKLFQFRRTRLKIWQSDFGF